ncbi:hypothetical protein ABE65_011460 [Fictibacillus phosphorivorans]|uniref:Uncharacterized protein n=1 Tax=Fictibacillus phosphorivorans TaxID=1221500 RepID=A0A168W193_9BACL|nr:hypothetical protein ABE65_011460 [Fictibacillus phosphorivorans]
MFQQDLFLYGSKQFMAAARQTDQKEKTFLFHSVNDFFAATLRELSWSSYKLLVSKKELTLNRKCITIWLVDQIVWEVLYGKGR